MSAPAENSGVRAELDALCAEGLLAPDQHRQLVDRYPTTAWDVVRLVRWFTLLGALGMAAGICVLAPKVIDGRVALEIALSGAAAGLLFGARRVAQSGLARTAAAMELCASLALQGLTAVLAIHFSTGSKNWPALVGVDAALACVLAYALDNRLILIQTCVNTFTFLGGETGYASDWGAYWLGMDYPARFLAAGLATLAVAFAHLRWIAERWRPFARVYAHFGALSVHLSLWFLSLFGWYNGRLSFDGTVGVRVLFTLVWGALSAGSYVYSRGTGLAVLGGYGLTFFVINLYTAYFQFVVAHTGELWFLHLLLVGGSLIGVALAAERWRSAQKTGT